LLEDKADATWVFMNWEGLAAQKADIKLNAMYLSEFNVPYGYSPVIMASEDHIHKKEEALKSFLKAAKKGFLYAKSNPKESVELMQKYIPKPDQEAIDLPISQQYTNQFYGDATNWGQMESSRVNNFINWLNENQLETEITSADELIDNSLLPQ
jgi:ABC-type nitrate/sulfonate/bicarbonate transport system substrate-binding protein